MTITTKARVEIAVIVGSLVLTAISSGMNRDNKEEGKELIEKARLLSDIRAEGAPPFRMEGTFRITAIKDGKESEGRYTEVWISKSKWRREVQTDSFHRIEVGEASGEWLADEGTDRPEAALYGPLTLIFYSQPREIHRVSSRELGSARAICAESKNVEWSKTIDCIDPNNGVFLVQESLSTPPDSPPSVHSCAYQKYEGFGNRLFPRYIRCKTNPGNEIELKIAKLETAGPVDESLFSEPPQAVEIGTCERKISPPRALQSPAPEYPANHSDSATVVLSIIVGKDGKPLNPEIVATAGKDFDQAALAATRNWRFKPATCDGTPYPVKVNLEIQLVNSSGSYSPKH
jgi:TonB family protein